MLITLVPELAENFHWAFAEGSRNDIARVGKDGSGLEFAPTRFKIEGGAIEI